VRLWLHTGGLNTLGDLAVNGPPGDTGGGTVLSITWTVLNLAERRSEPDSKAYARARRLIPNWIAAKVMKAARVSARFS
jgi:hypothetical protein